MKEEKDKTHEELMGMNHKELARYALELQDARYALELQKRCAAIARMNEDNSDRAAAEIARADRLADRIRAAADALGGIVGILDTYER